MQVVHVGSEVFPYSRSGGLGDVLGALPAEQARLGAQVTVVSPWYAGLAGTPAPVWEGRMPEVSGALGNPVVRLGEIVEGGVRYVFIGMGVFERPGLYHDDDVWRYSLFGR